MPEKEYEQLTAVGIFTVRRSNRYWSGTWSDMIIEQYLMKGFKSSGGLTHGRGIIENTLAQWIKAMPASRQVCEFVEKVTGVCSATTEQHVELRESRQFHDEKHLRIYSGIHI